VSVPPPRILRLLPPLDLRSIDVTLTAIVGAALAIVVAMNLLVEPAAPSDKQVPALESRQQSS